jgi:N-acetylmuramoyl-L-alanine amidase
VVIDAGHGGSFTGAQVNGIYEKDINLIISRKIQSLAKEYNVDVIMTRETDMTPGSKELRESLEYIAALPKNKNADLFISIHANMTPIGVKGKIQTSSSGFQIWIPGSTSYVYDGSVKLGSVLTEVIKSDYIIEPKLKQTPGDDGNILILKKATVPAVVIECGYMDNVTDLKYLQDDKNQEKIARDILEGIKRYSLAADGSANETHSNDTVITNQELTENVIQHTTTINNGTSEISPTAVSESKEIASDSVRPRKKVEVEANYPGDADSWKTYLFKNLNYPKAAVNNEVQGEVIVEFIVNTDGSISKVHAISGPKELRAESVKVVKESGYWVPAMNKGIKVSSYKKQPIVYKLEVK